MQKEEQTVGQPARPQSNVVTSLMPATSLLEHSEVGKKDLSLEAKQNRGSALGAELSWAMLT